MKKYIDTEELYEEIVTKEVGKDKKITEIALDSRKRKTSYEEDNTPKIDKIKFGF